MKILFLYWLVLNPLGCLGKIFLKAEAASLLENPVSSTSR